MARENLYRLRDTTAVEPLVNRWAAWSHVISPVPASLHLKGYQLELLRSYVHDPKVHVDACENPEMRSGPFVDIPVERAGEVRDLLETTEAHMAPNLELAETLFEFHNRLVGEAGGQCLEPYYNELPESLRGFVELVYDYYNRPTVRFFEGMMYRSPYYDDSLQSLCIGAQERDNGRSFFMNTPRLPQPGQIDWKLPFRSPEIDDLFRLDLVGQPLGSIRELLGLEVADEPRLAALLTRDPAPRVERWNGPEIRIRYVGHACVLIEWQGISMLTDACVGTRAVQGGIDRFSYQDLPEVIDYVLITHNHQDHFWPETLLRLRHRVGCLVVPRSAGMLYGDLSLRLVGLALGFKNVVELDALDTIPLPDGEIIGVPFMGEHADLAHGKIGYVIRAGSHQMLFGADSDCLDQGMYDNLRSMLGPIETVFMGMECVGAPLTWSCGPFLPIKVSYEQEQTRRYKGCDSERALKIVEAVGAKRIYLYALGLEPWYEHILGLAYSEGSPQLTECKKLVGEAPHLDLEAKLMFGKRELLLDAWSPRPAARVQHAATAEPSPEPSPVGAVHGTADSLEEEFVFD
jgi:L-ascorbate metabolism protein UlaG (beta-lactamase superfamily)